MPIRSLPKTRKDKSPSKDPSSGRTKKAEQNAIQTSNVFDVLDDGGDEMDITSLHHPTTIKVAHNSHTSTLMTNIVIQWN